MKTPLRLFSIAIWLIIVVVELSVIRTAGSRPLRVVVVAGASVAIVSSLIEWVRERKRTP